MVIIGCDLASGDDKTVLVLHGPDAVTVFHATAKLHKSEIGLLPDTETAYWDSKYCRYILECIDGVYRLTIIPLEELPGE